jgi:hypothetical protein
LKFECGDLERALAVPELMQEAREHLRECPRCRQELRLWNEISETAKHFHEEWESPDLWIRIKHDLAAQAKPEHKPWWGDWKVWAMAASIVLGAVLLFWLNRSARSREQLANRDFLTEQALQDVERTEAAYRQSVEKLYELARPRLQSSSSPIAVNTREKLMLLDSAINDVRSNLQQNRFNASLQTQLAALYREKQVELQELLTHDQKN